MKNRNAAVLMERPFIYESIDQETGEYVKSSCREVEQLGFYIRIMQVNFVPCECCQRRLIKEMLSSKQWTIGNKDTNPPVELWRRFEIDDSSWKELERRKPTKEEKEKLGKFGQTTYLK